MEQTRTTQPVGPERPDSENEDESSHADSSRRARTARMPAQPAPSWGLVATWYLQPAAVILGFAGFAIGLFAGDAQLLNRSAAVLLLTTALACVREIGNGTA